MSDPKKALLVAASPMTHPRLNFELGFWAAELSHPYAELMGNDIEITIASPDGGEIKVDGYSDPRHESGYSAYDYISLGFLESPTYAPLLQNTAKLDEVSASDFDTVLVVGGQSPMFTFRDNAKLKSLIGEFYEAGKPTAALCHGVSALMDVMLSDGSRLIEGKRITGFSLAEDKFSEKEVGAQIFDWYIEEDAKALGANYVENGMWANFAVADGNLITGQQQRSGARVAQLVVAALNER